MWIDLMMIVTTTTIIIVIVPKALYFILSTCFELVSGLNLYVYMCVYKLNYCIYIHTYKWSFNPHGKNL
jgi:hypothetical protein